MTSSIPLSVASVSLTLNEGKELIAILSPALFVASAVYGLYTPIIPYQLAEQGRTDISVLTGYFASAYAGGLIISSPATGYLGKRFEVSLYASKSYKGLTLVAQDKRSIIMALIGILAVSDILLVLKGDIPSMMAARCLQGIATAGIWTVAIAVLVENVSLSRAGILSAVAMVLANVGTLTGVSCNFANVCSADRHPHEPSYCRHTLHRCRLALCRLPRPEPLHRQSRCMHSLLDKGSDRQWTTARRAKSRSHADCYSANNNCHVELEGLHYKQETRCRQPHWDVLCPIHQRSAQLPSIRRRIKLTSRGLGLVTTALSLVVVERYGLTAAQTSLCFLAISLPAALVAPLAVSPYCADPGVSADPRIRAGSPIASAHAGH